MEEMNSEEFWDLLRSAETEVARAAGLLLDPQGPTDSWRTEALAHVRKAQEALESAAVMHDGPPSELVKDIVRILKLKMIEQRGWRIIRNPKAPDSDKAP